MAVQNNDVGSGVSGTSLQHLGGRRKRIFDLLIALVLIVVLSPLFVIAALSIVVTGGMPVIVRQRRIGFNGRSFWAFKFRTMIRADDDVLDVHLASSSAARAEWERTGRLQNDPRLTALGFMLRRSRVDELPLLFNVVAGDMSLIGPRALVAQDVTSYGSTSYDYYRQARPGIVGLSERRASACERADTDRAYVQNWSMATDLKILVRVMLEAPR